MENKPAANLIPKMETSIEDPVPDSLSRSSTGTAGTAIPKQETFQYRQLPLSFYERTAMALSYILAMERKKETVKANVEASGINRSSGSEVPTSSANQAAATSSASEVPTSSANQAATSSASDVPTSNANQASTSRASEVPTSSANQAATSSASEVPTKRAKRAATRKSYASETTTSSCSTSRRVTRSVVRQMKLDAINNLKNRTLIVVMERIDHLLTKEQLETLLKRKKERSEAALQNDLSNIKVDVKKKTAQKKNSKSRTKKRFY